MTALIIVVYLVGILYHIAEFRADQQEFIREGSYRKVMFWYALLWPVWLAMDMCYRLWRKLK